MAVARPLCLYCGAALGAEAVAAAAAATLAAERSRPLGGPQPIPPPLERALVILDLHDTGADVVAAALGLAGYEAALRVKRGGFQLHRILSPEQSAAEAGRLASHGLRAVVVPEAELRAQTVLVLGGRLDGGALDLRLETGRLRVESADVYLVVGGPIAREYQTRAPKKGLPLATLEAGHRFHLQLRRSSNPVELDPWAFAFGPGSEVGRSSLLTLAGWIESVFPGVPVDDGFRRLVPALSPAADETGGAAPLLKRKTEKRETALILDNVPQFRFYSAWRAAVERRRRG